MRHTGRSDVLKDVPFADLELDQRTDELQTMIT